MQAKENLAQNIGDVPGAHFSRGVVTWWKTNGAPGL